MSLRLMSISSTPWLEMISKVGEVALAHIDLHHALVQLALAELLAQLLARALMRFCPAPREPFNHLPPSPPSAVSAADAEAAAVEQPLFGVQLGLVFHFFQLLFAHHVDGDLHQVADHRLHIAAHIADFGELRGLHFQKRRVGQLGQPARNLRFAHARRPDHDDVLGHDLFGEIGRQLLPAHAVAQRNGHGALGGLLADDVLVQLGDNLARRQFIERESVLLQRYRVNR